MSSESGESPQYWFNTRTRTVEKGRQSSWEHLMGPYDSEAEASRALEKAQERTEAWDDDDAEWRGDQG